MSVSLIRWVKFVLCSASIDTKCVAIRFCMKILLFFTIVSVSMYLLPVLVSVAPILSLVSLVTGIPLNDFYPSNAAPLTFGNGIGNQELDVTNRQSADFMFYGMCVDEFLVSFKLN